MIAQLIFFITVCAGSGYAMWRLLGMEEEDKAAKFFMAMGLGIVFFVQASVVLGALGLAWWPIYLALTGGLLLLAYKDAEDFKLSLPDISDGWKIVILLFVIHLAVYYIGSSNYPWLEDDDPWEHAEGVRFVSLHGTYIQPDSQLIKYLAPYPPFYDVLLGVAFQIGGAPLQASMKFLNSLLISLAIPFFFAWAKERFGGKRALWAAFVLAVLPSFMSHFIWAQTLSVMLVFPALYFVERHLKAEGAQRNGFAIAAVLSMAAAMITAPSPAATFFGLMAGFVAALFIVKAWENRKLDKKALSAAIPTATIFIAAFALALAEFWIPMFVMFPTDVVFSHLSLSGSIFTEKTADTSGGIVYGFQDFWEAPFASKMDQPVGWGAFAMILALGGLWVAVKSFRERKESLSMAILIIWFIFCMVGTEGNLLPVKLVPHRFWVFLAIPVAMLAGVGAARFHEHVERGSKGFALALLVLLVGGLLATSAAPKYVVETSMWPPGAGFISQEQFSGYVNLGGALPAETRVAAMCGGPFSPLNGFSMMDYSWEREVIDYRTRSITDSVEGNYGFLKKYGYEYAIFDHGCIAGFQPEQVNQKLSMLEADPRFMVDQRLSGNAFIVFRVI
ncbi:MAG: hypothetical protein AB1295_01550 [Candidatus Micrarchaeota archaeon]